VASADRLFRVAQTRARGIYLSNSQTILPPDDTTEPPRGLAAFRWPELSPPQRNSLLAAGLSWLFSGFAVMLYSALLPQLLPALHMDKSTAGLLNALMLVATGIGSYVFGVFADRYGRKRSLIYSILTFTTFTFLSGLAANVVALAVCRFAVGLGMGGEWTSGTALVAESWPSDRRARAVGIVQSGYAVGYALAVVTVGLLSPLLTWRGVFFLGLLPALFTLWLRENVTEPAIWKAQAQQTGLGATEKKILWRAALPRLLALLGMNTFGLFAWWGLFSWVPAYLALPTEQGGRSFHSLGTVTFVVLLSLAGMVPGYLCFGGIADRFGRKKSVILYLCAAALCVPFFAEARQPSLILVFGCVTAFFGSGFFVGSGTLASELFPTKIRAVALGVSYNAGRALSALAPWLIGHLGETHGLGWAFSACGVAYACAALSALFIPETSGSDLK
jgi:MFS family permease